LQRPGRRQARGQRRFGVLGQHQAAQPARGVGEGGGDRVQAVEPDRTARGVRGYGALLRTIMAAGAGAPVAMVVLVRASLIWLPVAARSLRPRVIGTRTIAARGIETRTIGTGSIGTGSIGTGTVVTRTSGTRTTVLARPVAALATRRAALRALLRVAEIASGIAASAVRLLASRGTALWPLLPATEVAPGLAGPALRFFTARWTARRSLLGATEAASWNAVRRPMARSARPVGVWRFHVRSIYAGPRALPSRALGR
jgi:hypothetical protein